MRATATANYLSVLIVAVALLDLDLVRRIFRSLALRGIADELEEK